MILDTLSPELTISKLPEITLPFFTFPNLTKTGLILIAGAENNKEVHNKKQTIYILLILVSFIGIPFDV